MKMLFEDNGYISEFAYTYVCVQVSPHCWLSESIICSLFFFCINTLKKESDFRMGQRFISLLRTEF